MPILFFVSYNSRTTTKRNTSAGSREKPAIVHVTEVVGEPHQQIRCKSKSKEKNVLVFLDAFVLDEDQEQEQALGTGTSSSLF